MNARSVIGKRILGIAQERVRATKTRPGYTAVTQIRLEGGVSLVPHTIEGEDCYSTDFIIRRSAKAVAR